jgi:hypothetical protein
MTVVSYLVLSEISRNSVCSVESNISAGEMLGRRVQYEAEWSEGHELMLLPQSEELKCALPIPRVQEFVIKQ